MNGDGKRAGGTGAWMVIALCCLAGCNAAPEGARRIADARRAALDGASRRCGWRRIARGRRRTSSRSPAVSGCAG